MLGGSGEAKGYFSLSLSLEFLFGCASFVDAT